MVLRVMPAEQKLIGGWFTFTAAGGATAASQAWYTFDNGEPGSGRPPGTAWNGTTNSASFGIYASSGGRFNQTTPVPSNSLVGSGSIQFTSCTSATLTYSFYGGEWNHSVEPDWPSPRSLLRSKIMNRSHSSSFIVIAMMPVAMVFSAPSVSAETRVDAGYVYIDGRNEARHPGASMWDEDYNDWRQVDSGHGAALSFRHDWTRLYAKGAAQRLTLANRNEYRTLVSPWPPAGQPVTNEVLVERNRYDERYSSYELQLGWRQPWSELVSVWGELGAVREVWSRSGGSTVSYYEGISEPEEFDLPPASASEWAWTAAAGVDFALGQAADLSVGVDYRNRGYFPSVATLINNLHRPSSSLLQGVIRYQQQFAGPWQGFVEYRPSEKRQYWQAGIGYRF